MEKIIKLETKEKKELCRMFGVSMVTLWSALTYRTHSGMARTLRAAAIEHGGREIIQREDDGLSDFETKFDTSAGLMIQSFGNKAQIKVDIPTNTVSVIINDVEKMKETGVTATRLMQIQSQVSQSIRDLN